MSLCFLPLTVEEITGIFVKGYTAAALFIALGFYELDFGPKPAFIPADIPLALALVTGEELEGG